MPSNRASATSSGSIAVGCEHQVAGAAGGGEHVGAHALRADRVDLDAAVPVGQRQPLGEGERAVLGDAVRGGADHGEQSGGGDGGDEPAAAALQPVGQQRVGGADMRHDVDVPGSRPDLLVGRRARRREATPALAQ